MRVVMDFKNVDWAAVQDGDTTPPTASELRRELFRESDFSDLLELGVVITVEDE